MTTLPEGEPDLVEIGDKAGDFLIHAKDLDNAPRLYRAAEGASQNTATYWAGIGYCLCKLDQCEEGISAYRRAVDLEPTNPTWLNDLGWALITAGQLPEARSALGQAIALSSGDHDLARENPEVVERLIR